MQRNWETIREILLIVEANKTNRTLHLCDFDSDRMNEINYHVLLLSEAKFIEASMSGRLGFVLRRLTWKGHELLDSIRNDTVWNKTKSVFKQKGVEMTFDTVKAVAAMVSKRVLDVG